MSDKLPQGWTRTSLGAIGRYINGRAFKPAEWEKRGLPIIRIQNLNDSTALFNYSSRQLDERFRVRRGDLLIAWSASLGAFIWNGDEAWLNQHIFRVEPDTRCCTKEFLFHAVRHAIDELYDKTHGTGMVHVTKPVFEAHQIPLPPPAEQRRLVAELEQLLERVDACKHRLDRIPALLKRFRQSVLAAACSGRLTADWREENDSLETWRTAEFSEFIESSFYGPRFGKESYSKQGVPTIRTTDMGFDGSIVLKNAPCLVLSRLELEKFGLRNGDFLVTRTGATIGKCALYDKSIGPAIPGAYLIRFRLKHNLIAPKFVLLFFMSPVGQNLLVGGSTAVAQPNVNATTISQFEISVAPLAEQQEIVRRVEELFALADQLEARYTKARAHVEKLTPSLLAKAFRGELVPQDPNDEPASALLERIRNAGTHKL